MNVNSRDMLEKELRRKHLSSKEFLKEERLLEVAKRFSFNTVSDLLAAIGDSVVTAGGVINRIKEIYFSEAQVEDILKVPVSQESDNKRYNAALSIKGVDDVAIRLAHCCNPLPGDRVLGYITRGRGVSVHREDCPNLQNYLRQEKERVIEVEWADSKGKYVVELEVKAFDRPRLTTDVLTVIADQHVQINSVFSRVTRNQQAVMDFKLEIKDMNQLQALMQRIQKVHDVLEVRRSLPGEIRGD